MVINTISKGNNYVHALQFLTSLYLYCRLQALQSTGTIKASTASLRGNTDYQRSELQPRLICHPDWVTSSLLSPPFHVLRLWMLRQKRAREPAGRIHIHFGMLINMNASWEWARSSLQDETIFLVVAVFSLAIPGCCRFYLTCQGEIWTWEGYRATKATKLLIFSV